MAYTCPSSSPSYQSSLLLLNYFPYLPLALPSALEMVVKTLSNLRGADKGKKTMWH